MGVGSGGSKVGIEGAEDREGIEDEDDDAAAAAAELLVFVEPVQMREL